jgi:probable 2-oxoglutarate dehydrogenase E1 component DHKTD1
MRILFVTSRLLIRPKNIICYSYYTDNCFGHWEKTKRPENTVSGHLLNNRAIQANLWRLATAFHDNGHKRAQSDPLGSHSQSSRFDIPELHPEYYNLDVSGTYDTNGILFNYHQEGAAPLSDILQYLDDTYCGRIGLEVSHITDIHEKEWILRCYERHAHSKITPDIQLETAQQLLKSQAFDNFMAVKFATVKRYGAEGSESMMTFIDNLFKKATDNGVREVVMCMPHRGRLNLLVNSLNYPPKGLFHKIKGNSEFPPNIDYGTGDVISHLVSSVDLQFKNDMKLHVTMIPNPSHLEAVNPVAMGKARAKMLTHQTGPYTGDTSSHDIKVLCLQIHGDASFAAQGIVMESLAIGTTPYYDIGGCIHLIVDNSLGFTTPSDYGRSSSYCSDVGKMIGSPILHVNGYYPNEVIKACNVALEYNLHYNKDVVIVLNCYRRWGHNELDDPSMTQPLMYKLIDSLSSIPDHYWKQLLDDGLVTQESSNFVKDYHEMLNQSFKESEKYVPQSTNLQAQWEGFEQPSTSQITEWDTGLPVDLLKYIGGKSVDVPEGFVVHSRLKKAHVSDRKDKIQNDRIDWSTAEAMAFGSLMCQGYNVRLSGQDVGRGTFSHRHMMLIDQTTDAAYVPLNHLTDSQSNFIEIANSPLSEEAVLGFEFGFSIDNPLNCVIWEAQFGDFFNGAQVIIDAFISSAEDKWLMQSGLIMLLPHGYDGAGPEHSSCRIERFLQMTNSKESGFDGDSVNMHIAHPTTPSQYYHLIRRQMIRNFRKPLIVQSPKTLLRLPAAVSSLIDMSPGTTFRPVIGDYVDPQFIKKVVVCSGKHYYALDSYRKANKIEDTAIIRLELLCPFPSGALYSELMKYSNAQSIVKEREREKLNERERGVKSEKE